MNCPLCSTETTDGAEECPSCGALFAKLRQRAEREKKEAQAALALAEAPPPAQPVPIWRLRAAAIVIVAAWIIGFGLYLRHWMKKSPANRGPRVYSEGSVLRLRDPATGDLKKVEITVSPRVSRPEPPPRPEAESGTPAGAPAYDPDFDE